MEKVNKNKKLFKILCLTLVIIGILIFIFFDSSDKIPVLMVYSFGCFVFLLFFHQIKIKKVFKETVIPYVLKEYKPSLEFIPKLEAKDIFQN